MTDLALCRASPAGSIRMLIYQSRGEASLDFPFTFIAIIIFNLFNIMSSRKIFRGTI